MAKLQGPLFSLDARGKLGNTLVYAIWKGINYCRKYVIPYNPNTTGQQTIRTYFTQAVAAYRGEDQATKDAWNTFVKNLGSAMSGFNYYLAEFIKATIADSGTPPTTPYMPPS